MHVIYSRAFCSGAIACRTNSYLKMLRAFNLLPKSAHFAYNEPTCQN